MCQVDTTFINDEEENKEAGETGEGNIGKLYISFFFYQKRVNENLKLVWYVDFQIY